jgi:hypothetical protein
MENKIIIQFDYKTLKNTQYVGEFGEQLIRLNFTINNIDTFIPLIDDKAIDFIARTENSKYFDIQVKTIRWTKERYFYEVKEKWGELIRPNLLIAFVILISEKEPILILIPGENWVEESRNNKIFANRDYEGKKKQSRMGFNYK